MAELIRYQPDTAELVIYGTSGNILQQRLSLAPWLLGSLAPHEW
ncbi:MAG: hypothetical protein AAF827_19390 [Cyanobacteria bacterium P01_D01_bin.6]